MRRDFDDDDDGNNDHKYDDNDNARTKSTSFLPNNQPVVGCIPGGEGGTFAGLCS
jgi:hypothetical protein